MFVRDWRRTLYTHPLWLIAGLFLAGLLLVGLGGRYAEEKERRSFVAYSERLMQTFVERQQQELEKLARDYAIWDLFAEKVRGEEYDADWLKKNITESVYRNFEIVDALVLTASLKPVYYLHRGEEASVRELADWHPEFASILGGNLVKRPSLSSLSGFIRKEGGGLQLLVAERIRPEHPSSVGQGGGWLILVRNVDNKWLADTNHLLSIKSLTFSNSLPAKGAPQLVLHGLDRNPLTWLSWSVDRQKVVGFSSKPLLAGVFFLFLFVLLLARAVLQMHKRQSAVHERMLLQSEVLRRLSRVPSSSAAEEAHYLQEVVRAVCGALHAGLVTLWHVDPTCHKADCLAASDSRDIAEEVFSPQDHADFLNLLQEQRVLVIENTDGESRFASLSGPWIARKTVAEMGVAVMVRGRLAGFLRVEVTGVPCH